MTKLDPIIPDQIPLRPYSKDLHEAVEIFSLPRPLFDAHPKWEWSCKFLLEECQLRWPDEDSEAMLPDLISEVSAKKIADLQTELANYRRELAALVSDLSPLQHTCQEMLGRRLSEVAMKRIAELEALIGTVRGLIGCEDRNVKDITPEQHSHEIIEVFEGLKAALLATQRALEEAKQDLEYAIAATNLAELERVDKMTPEEIEAELINKGGYTKESLDAAFQRCKKTIADAIAARAAVAKADGKEAV